MQNVIVQSSDLQAVFLQVPASRATLRLQCQYKVAHEHRVLPGLLNATHDPRASVGFTRHGIDSNLEVAAWKSEFVSSIALQVGPTAREPVRPAFQSLAAGAELVVCVCQRSANKGYRETATRAIEIRTDRFP